MASISPRLTNLIAVAVFAFLLLAAIFFAWFKLYQQNAMPFKQVKIITTANYIPRQQLQRIVKDNLQGGFFSIKIDLLKNELSKLAWVDGVAIKREWPNRLQILITEQQPVARWDQTQIFNSLGHLFTPPVSSIPKQLPSLQGPASLSKSIWQQYQAFNVLIASLGLSIDQLQVSQRLSWQLRLSNGLWVVLGREDIDQRLQRFVRLYQRVILQKNKQAVSVDMRYPNGMAVRWKERAK